MKSLLNKGFGLLQKLIKRGCLQVSEIFAKILVMDDLVEKLKDLGLNSYEAKVYIALLKKYPATGYEVSQLADIPQSRAYDALKSLEVERIVYSTNEKPQKYSPIAPKELTQRFKRSVNSTIDYLEKRLPNLKEDYNEPIHTICGYENTIKKLKEVIQNTKNSLFLEVWSGDYKHLEGAISDAYDRGVDIKIVGYDNFYSMYGLVYVHEGGPDIEYNAGGRLVYLLSDNCEAVFGRIEKQVIWTKNMDIAYMLKEFVVRNMAFLDINKHFPEQLRYFYGAGFKKLKDRISDKKNAYNIH